MRVADADVLNAVGAERGKKTQHKTVEFYGAVTHSGAEQTYTTPCSVLGSITVASVLSASRSSRVIQDEP